MKSSRFCIGWMG